MTKVFCRIILRISLALYRDLYAVAMTVTIYLTSKKLILIIRRLRMKKIVMMLVVACLSFNIYAQPVDINKANAQEISDALKGVGLKKADAIVKYRQQHGAFSSVDELANVKGIGEKTIKKNKKNIYLKAVKKNSEKKSTKSELAKSK